MDSYRYRMNSDPPLPPPEPPPSPPPQSDWKEGDEPKKKEHEKHGEAIQSASQETGNVTLHIRS